MIKIPLSIRAENMLENMVDLNATQAAIRAGYSARTADKQCTQLLGNSRARAAIEVEMKEREAVNKC